MLNNHIRERILWLFSWEALFARFGDLRRSWRRILGALVHASCLSGVAVFYLSSESYWVLLAPVLFAVSIAAYVPLSAYLRRLDHQRAGNRLLAVNREMDVHEAELLREAMDNARHIQGFVLIAGVLYSAYASTQGWRLPETMEGWGAIVFAVAWLFVYTLPTVVAAWIDRDDHLDEIPDSESLD